MTFMELTGSPHHLVGQYADKDFSEVEKWIKHFTNEDEPGTGLSFEYYLELRCRYLRERNPLAAQSVVNIIKNDLSVRRDAPVPIRGRICSSIRVTLGGNCTGGISCEKFVRI
jgi:hypothetical protein